MRASAPVRGALLLDLRFAYRAVPDTSAAVRFSFTEIPRLTFPAPASCRS
jgi:hypothetical protein